MKFLNLTVTTSYIIYSLTLGCINVALALALGGYDICSPPRRSLFFDGIPLKEN